MPSITGCPGVVVKGGVGTVDDTAQMTVGSRTYGTTGDEYIYLLGLLGTVAGSAVTYDAATGITTLLAANAIGPVAFATAATVASKYGWYCLKSPAAGMLVATDAGIVSGSKGYADGTAGRVDDTVVTGDQLSNFVFRGTDTSNQALAQFDYPYASDSLG